MFTITEAASAYLAQVLDQSTTADHTAVRIVPATQGNLALRFDTPRPDDTTFEHGGRTVLLIAPGIAQRLIESMLDVKDTDNGSELVLQTLTG